jgi:hypothetical protein
LCRAQLTHAKISRYPGAAEKLRLRLYPKALGQLAFSKKLSQLQKVQKELYSLGG